MPAYTYQLNDLDLFSLDKEQDPDKIVPIFASLIESDSDFKIFPARQWIENFLHYGGIRDIYSRFSSGTVVGASLMQAPSTLLNVNRRRVAKTFKAVQVQASNVTRQRPSVKVWPIADDERANKKAKLSNILIDYLWDFDQEDDMNYESLLWALLTPAVARKDSLDYSFDKSRIWPLFEKDQEGNDIIGPDQQPVVVLDQSGKPVMEQLPWNKSELVSAFRLIFPPSATWIYDLPYIGDVSLKRLQHVHQNYSKTEEGYHPENLEKLERGMWKFTPIMAMENAIKQLSFGAFRAYRNWNHTWAHLKDGVVMANFFIEPSPNYPEGREIVIANGLMMYDGKSRVYREAPTNWHPYSILTYERVPGRLWGTTYAEKITDINRAYEQGRTEFDQLRRTFSKPKMILPTGAQIDRDTITGDEQVFRYNPYGPDGGKPAFINPPQPPSTILDDIKLTASEFTEISGVTEIMQGIRPQGVTTYRGLEVLREEASNAASNFIRMYEAFVQRSQFNKLENIRRALVYPDKNLVNAVKIFKKMNQYVTDVDIEDFTGDDIAGYVKIEPFSSIGKSRLAMQEKYMSLAEQGVLGDIVNDPELNSEFKRKMGVMGFDKPQNRQVMYAKYENQLMLSAQEKSEAQGQEMVINPPVMPWHDDAIHIREIDQLLLDPTLINKPMVMKSLIAHRAGHTEQIARRQAEALVNVARENDPGQDPSKGGQGGRPDVVGGQGEQGVLFGPETGFVSGEEPNLT